MPKKYELEPCPLCRGEIKIYTNIDRGAFARCNKCKKEFDVCGVDDIPIYHGVKIRKSTVRKIAKMWNSELSIQLAKLHIKKDN